MSGTSYTRVPALQVRAACDAWLALRNTRITSERETLIRREMQRRWFPAKTREDALKRLQADIWGPYGMVAEQGGFWAHIVEELRDLALAAQGGAVHLCPRDASLLVDYLQLDQQPAA